MNALPKGIEEKKQGKIYMWGLYSACEEKKTIFIHLLFASKYNYYFGEQGHLRWCTALWVFFTGVCECVCVCGVSLD